ncbi:hypothetical protein AM499_06895 [Bacillus sp. FJAT-22090]|uniref:hypothetical protein n=1 Tax=Bacillus sp. FJAT-22090 TaxID=1581038 RepID=UPI0006AE8BE1|nr:hypothetical protein [Bacillus sp. FJAT-22090]ALC85578.1 hypothetical protein AM499_06895 [Bacillus sp. FJAT-22090]
MPKKPVTNESALYLMNEVNKFLDSKITEHEFVEKHDKRGKVVTWPESVWLYLNNRQLFSKLLYKLSATNRRMALFQSMRFTQDELMKLLECGKSTITDLLHPSTRRIGVETLALFGIIHRVPFSWVKKDQVINKWDSHNFDHLDDRNQNNKNDVDRFKEKIIFTSERRIQGDVVNIQGNLLYLRIENRSNIVIVDLVNPNTRNEQSLLSIFEQNDYQWVSFLYPSVVPYYYFKIFVGYNDEDIKDSLIKNEFPFVNPIYKIQYNK